MIGQFIAALVATGSKEPNERTVYPMPFPPDVSQGTRRLIIADDAKVVLMARQITDSDNVTVGTYSLGTFKPDSLFYDYKGQLWRVI